MSTIITKADRIGQLEWRLFENEGSSQLRGMLKVDPRRMKGREDPDVNSPNSSFFVFWSGVDQQRSTKDISGVTYTGWSFLNMAAADVKAGKKDNILKEASVSFNYQLIIDFVVDKNLTSYLFIPAVELHPDPNKMVRYKVEPCIFGPGGVRNISLMGTMGNIALAQWETFHHETIYLKEPPPSFPVKGEDRLIKLNDFYQIYNRDRFTIIESASCVCENAIAPDAVMTCGSLGGFAILSNEN